LLLCIVASTLLAADAEKSSLPAPTVDRVGFPNGYLQAFQVLRTVTKTNEQKVVTIYGNYAAASVTNAVQLPYPYGSVIVRDWMPRSSCNAFIKVEKRASRRPQRWSQRHRHSLEY
jgi:hypothetical protein